MILIAGLIGISTIILVGVALYAALKEKGKDRELSKELAGLALFVLFLGGAISLGLAVGYPSYRIWQQEKEGAAELARAEQNRQIAIQEAKAKEESAKSLANAEVIRAEGVAKANKIIGDSLQNNDAYIHYLWIEALKESHDQVIYVPTEAGIPVTESARFLKNKQQGE